MLAIWRADFQLSVEDFWQATLDEFRSIYGRWEEGERGRYLRSAVIATMIYNTAMGAKKTIKPEDIYPFLQRRSSLSDARLTVPQAKTVLGKLR